MATAHRARAEQWTHPYRARRAAGAMHPIYDFLFIYYRNKPSQLEQWHPGLGVGLEAAPLGTPFKPTQYRIEGGLTRLAPELMTDATRHRMEMARQLCIRVRDRPPAFGCFGMHEWAMVYRGDVEGAVRHAERLPLRLSQAATDAYVRSRPIQCSHFDAFRFFTPGAKAFNRLQPDKDNRLESEQCGCLHTNMDLYKLAAQCMPWLGSDLLWQCFEFAVSARQLDMQASPYDCSSLGFEPVKVETPQGKVEYEQRQRALSREAQKLRHEFIERLDQILAPGR
ncbi:MAG: 3-methyladenine DNA glycosylase [Puniceicoccaceae bacterium]|nr:MAG: 3-methyladenine DNA glycosylase [Puniceicoccaceae bacterium]